MRIAIFTSQFPGRVNTFFARDVRALLDAGMDVDIFPLYPLDTALWPAVPACLGPEALPRGRVHHLRLLPALARAAHAGVPMAPALVDLSRCCASALRFGFTPVAKTAYAVAKAYAWACRPRGCYDHVLAYWGNYSATAAYVFRRLTCGDVPFSMFLHAGTDLYRDQVFLRTKLRQADNVIVVCEFNREFLERLYPDLRDVLRPKIHVHHLPLDLQEFGWSTVPRPAKDILAVGALEPQKGHDVLLRAMAALPPAHRDMHLRLVGDGTCRHQLERQASSYGLADRVSFAGWLTPDRTRQALSRATALVHPSAGLGDAVPTVIKEALAVGTPVIASKVAGIPELLDAGRCGVLVPANDHAALAAAIAHLLDNPELRAGVARRGRRYAERMFDVRQNGPRLASIIRGSGRSAPSGRVMSPAALES